MTPAPPLPAAVSSSRSARWIAIAVLGAVLVIGGAWSLKNRSAETPKNRTARGEEVRESASRHMDFDVALDIPGSPLGAASNGREIVLGNRKDPWGAIRIRRDGKGYAAEQIPILESRYQQRISVSALTWNGKNYVGLTTGSWFGKADTDVFTVHDPDTLGVIRTHDAPPLIGGLAWDGSSYWAATRRNTVDSNEEAFLYRLDRELNVVGKSNPPAVGCQGLAWDGSNLWFVDVFKDAIYVLDVSQAEPRVIHSASAPGNYASGVVSHDGAIWIADYDENRLQRLRETSRAAWLGTTPRVETASAGSPTSTIPDTESLDESLDESIGELRKKLRSEDWSERMNATMKLRSAGAPIDFARDQNNFVDREAAGTEDIDWSVEFRGDAVWLVSSSVWFGHDLFAKRAPSPSLVTVPVFARYTFTTRNPDGSESEKQLDATPGENVVSSIRLADASAVGEYEVSLFIHVQYIDANGTGRILNNSAGSLGLKK